MGKTAKHGKSAPADGQAATQGKASLAGSIPLVLVVGAIVAAVIPMVAIGFLKEGSPAVSNDVARGASGQVRQSSPTTEGLLGQFTAEHNESLLWGTYRPGILFGVKSRTIPESVVAGIMWTSISKEGQRIDGARLRHTCEESESREGLVFGYSEHDGSEYGKQTIVDPVHNLEMETSFLRSDSHTWSMRVAGNSSKRSKALYFYLGIDTEFAPQAELTDSYVRIEQAVEGKIPSTIVGRTPQLGEFKLTAVPSQGSLSPVDNAMVSWSMPPGTPVVKVKDALLQQLSLPSDGAKSKTGKQRHSLLQHAPEAIGASAVVVLQLVLDAEFEVDFVFQSGGNVAKSVAEVSGEPLTTVLRQRSSDFQKRFEHVFHLEQMGKYSDEQLRFARSAMSAMLGGLGYFFGRSKIKSRSATGAEVLDETSPKPLFTAVPSRSFFPRGFLWDEGFHQLLVGRWSAQLSRDVIAHWFNLMHEDGWIPREQILGAEAVSKVPDWAIPQHRTHANPPTFLLAIESLLERARMPDGVLDPDTGFWLNKIFPVVETWFRWFVDSQAGKEPGSFRWRGRDAGDGKLNAMTLSSGLDDYPRASSVSDIERHVDLHCWITLGSGLLARIGEQVGLPHAKVEEYRQLRAELVASLDKFHWDDKRKRYNDWGFHSNAGKYAPHIVIKCGTRDGSDATEHPVSEADWRAAQQGQRHPCPPSHPQFMFPLGDGQGGLMKRDKFIAKDEKPQFVDHTGYISLFPLFLRLVPPESPKLGALLDVLSDEKKGLWSEYGLRSMAPSDKMYLRDNAPGDAPYWRGPIWINCNFLAVSALRHYASLDGPHQQRAAELRKRLSDNLVKNIFENYQRTGYLWEQYNPTDGKGQRTHPFNGWSSLVTLIME